MLANLHVKYLALIEEADINFKDGLNILTGETGAGKSIILGSVNLALGGKAVSDLIRSGADYALTELSFDIESEAVKEKLTAFGVEELEEGQLITRELAEAIQNAAVPYVWVQGEERKIKVLSNMMVDL